MNPDTVEDKDQQLQPFSMAETITSLIAQSGHPKPDSWLTLAGGLKEEALTSPDVNIQRFLINRHWVQIFTSLPFDQIEKTRNARACLMNGECGLDDYTRLFKQIVVPCALELDLLPKQ